MFSPCLTGGGFEPPKERGEHRQEVGEVDHGLFGDLGQIGEEGAQVTGGAQLHRVPEPVGLSALGLDQRPVGVVQEEVTVQSARGTGPV